MNVRRWAVALIIAVASDLVSFATGFSVFPQLGVDVATALLIWAILGWRWVFLVALIAEALPVVSVFPTWTLVIVALKGTDAYRRDDGGVVRKD